MRRGFTGTPVVGVAKLQCGIYFKRRDYLSYMSERKCPSAKVKGGFTDTNIKGQSGRMKMQQANGPVRREEILLGKLLTRHCHGSFEQGIKPFGVTLWAYETYLEDFSCASKGFVFLNPSRQLSFALSHPSSDVHPEIHSKHRT